GVSARGKRNIALPSHPANASFASIETRIRHRFRQICIENTRESTPRIVETRAVSPCDRGSYLLVTGAHVEPSHPQKSAIVSAYATVSSDAAATTPPSEWTIHLQVLTENRAEALQCFCASAMPW